MTSPAAKVGANFAFRGFSEVRIAPVLTHERSRL